LALTIKLMGLPLKTKLLKNITVIKNKRIFQEMDLGLIAKKKNHKYLFFKQIYESKKRNKNNRF
jgi:hypothetical protein